MSRETKVQDKTKAKKGKSNKKKGAELQRLWMKWLHLEGWISQEAQNKLIYIPGVGQRSKSHDLFSCFDGVSFHYNRGLWWFWQITYPGEVAKRRKKIDLVRPPALLVVRVSVVTFFEGKDPENPRCKIWHWRVWDKTEKGVATLTGWRDPLVYGPWRKDEVKAVKLP